MGRIKIGVVNYLNTEPFIYGLRNGPVADQVELIADYPSRLADMLQASRLDIGLVPVAVLNNLPEYHIVGNYCIGTEGEIASVALFSEVPMTEIRRVYLDYQSRTSVALLRYLMREYWGIHPEIIDAKNEDYRSEIRGTTAGLVIGDRAFEQRKVSTYIYDLGSEWKAITGLPFVFAAWVSRERVSPDFVKAFDQSLQLGIDAIPRIAREKEFALFDLYKYYSLHLSYVLDERKRKAMELFLQVISESRSPVAG